MASWFGGLSSSLGCYLGPMSHSVVSLTKHISRCTKDVWMMECKTEESNELKRKEVETNKESIRPKVERFVTCYSDVDLENKQKTPPQNDLLLKGDIHNKVFIGKETLEIQKLENLQEDTQSGNAEAGFVPAMSSTLLGENIDLKASEYKYELEQKNLKMMILRERHEVMYHQLLKLQKATESINGKTSLKPATPTSITFSDNINHNASEYEHQINQQNLEMKILTRRNVAMKHKLLKLQKATECLNEAAGLLPVTSSASLGENIDPNATKYGHDLEQKSLEVKILTGRNAAMKHKLLKLQKATECLNEAAGLLPVTSSASLGENIDPNAAKYGHDLEKKSLEVKILTGRNIAMKHQLLKLRKATECLNEAAGLLPAMSSAPLGENINSSAAKYGHALEKKSLEVKILRGRNVAMKHKLLKLQKATECLNEAAGLLPVTSSASLGENIDPNAAKYGHDLEKKSLEVKILTGRNAAMKHKLLKLQKATECLNEAAGLFPVTSSASLGENIDPNAAKYGHDLEEKSLEVKILRGRNVAMKHKLLKLQKATECLNEAAGLLPVTSSASLGENIDPNAAKYGHDLEKKSLEVKILRGRNVAMKHKLLKLQKATECLNEAAGLLPVTSSASLGENIDPNAAKYGHDLEKKSLEVNILTGRNAAMKHQLLKLRKATECLNEAAGLLPVTSSASLGENIDPNAAKYGHDLEKKSLEVKILRGRNVAMKHKLLKLQKATECLNEAAGLLPASLGENINSSAAKYGHALEKKSLEVKILRGRNVAMKHKLLKLQKATECLNEAAGLLPVTSSASLGENIDPNAAKYGHDLEKKSLEVKILRGRNVAMKHKLLKLQKATECLNEAAGLLPASLGENINSSAAKYGHALEKKSLEVKILTGRNVAMKHKLLKLQKATECLNEAAGLLPASLGENINSSAAKYGHALEKKSLEVKILRGRNVAMKHKLLKLQKATECLNEAAGLLPVTSSASLGENIDPNAAKYGHDLGQKSLEVNILTGRNAAMKHQLLKLRKATECLNEAAGLLPVTSSASLGENIDPNAAKYGHDLEQKSLEVKILTGRNVAMKHKLLKLRKATECLNEAAGLLPVTSSASLGENIDPNAAKYGQDLEKKSLEVKILTGRNAAMKHKLLKLRKATECLNEAAGLLPLTSSASLGENIDPNAAKYGHDLEKKSLEVKILTGRNAAMKHKLLKLRKATECLNEAAGLLPVTSSASLGENIDPNAAKYGHDLEKKSLEVKILTGRNVAMKHKLLKLQKATECLNEAAGLLPASLGENINSSAAKYGQALEKKSLEVKILRGRNAAMKHKLLKLQKATECLNEAAGLLPASLGENINSSAAKYGHALEKKSLEVKILRGRNVAMKHKLLKLQKATECLNEAAGLLPVTSSASLGENIDPNAAKYGHDLEQKSLEVNILTGRNIAMKHQLLKLRKATECLNEAAGLLPVTSSASLGENIDPNAAKYGHDLEQKSLEVKILTGRNVAMKHKLLKLRKATECLNEAAGLLPVTSSASLGENIDPNAAKYGQDLEKKSLEVKILTGRNAAMKHKLLKLRKATECLNEAAGLLPLTSSASLGENIDPSAAKYGQDLEKKSLEVKILTGRNAAMKHKLLKLWKATECLNEAAGLLPVTSSASLGENIDPNAAKYGHDLEKKSLEVKILTGRNVAMKHKLLKLQKATECLNEAAGLLPASLGENINSSAAKYGQALEKKSLEVKILRGRNAAMKHKLLKLQKATECLNEAAGLLPASLGENINSSAAKYGHALEKKSLEVKILRGRNVAMKHKLLKLQKATECLNEAAGLLPVTSSASLGENIDPNAAKYGHDLEKKSLEVKILRGRNVAMKHKLLKLQKATECLNEAAGLLPVTSSASLGENIDSNAAKYGHDIEKKSLEVKILIGRNVAMKHKLLKLQKATECLNEAAGLLPVTSSASLGENIDPNAAKYGQDLEKKSLEVTILTGRNAAMKHKLLKLRKATECLNEAAGLLPVTSSASLGENIDPNATKYGHALEKKSLEVKILRGRNAAMKNKLLKIQKATECLNEAAGLLPAMSSASLGENINPSGSEYEHELEQKNLEVKILRGRNVAMKHKLLKLQKATPCVNGEVSLVPPMATCTSLGDNMDPNASECAHQLERRSIGHITSSAYQYLHNRITRWIWSKLFPAYSEISAACHA